MGRTTKGVTLQLYTNRYFTLKYTAIYFVRLKDMHHFGPMAAMAVMRLLGRSLVCHVVVQAVEAAMMREATGPVFHTKEYQLQSYLKTFHGENSLVESWMIP